MNQQSAVLYSNRSAVFLNLGNYQSALDDALKAIELDRTYVKGYYRAACAYYELGQYDKSSAILNSNEQTVKEIEDEVLELTARIKDTKERIDNYKSKYKSYEKFERFFAWLDKKESYYPKLELRFFSDCHRGIFAKNKIMVTFTNSAR